MSKSGNEVAEALAKLAVMIADECQEKNDVIQNGEGPGAPLLSFDQRVNAFKALTAYHVGIAKAKTKAPGSDDNDDEEGGAKTFNNFTRKLREVS